MNIYDRLIENPLFFKWIYHPSEEIESYWEKYLKTNSKEASRIIEFKSRFEQYFDYKNEKLTDIEKRALAKRIIRQLEKTEQKQEHFLSVRNIMRYAAVAIVFFTIGGSLVYLYLESRQSVELVNNSILPAQVQEPMLIINKQEIKLNEGKSELDYTNRDKIIVDKERSIIRESKNETPLINTLVIPYGSRSVITLSDGSIVWLNAGSRLIYPSTFVDKTREVFLVGEALFDVKKNESQPFVVKTADVKIAVKGTKFNVSAYPEDYSVQTVLAEGSVEINRTNASLFEKGITLVPGQMAYFNKKSKDTRIINVDINHYTLWTEGLFNFSNTDLNRITKRLERYYNINFHFDDPLSGTIQITGKLDVTQNMSEVFEYLSKLTGLEITKINERQYVIK
jgi:hypothetical protein